MHRSQPHDTIGSHRCARRRNPAHDSVTQHTRTLPGPSAAERHPRPRHSPPP
jgi:hypothetical protein